MNYGMLVWLFLVLCGMLLHAYKHKDYKPEVEQKYNLWTYLWTSALAFVLMFWIAGWSFT